MLLALVVCGVITSIVTGEDPIQVYAAIFKGSFGTPRKFWVLLQNIAMLLCVSLAVTPAFKMRFWNIGGEGQALIGALASAACMTCLGDTLPNWAVIALHGSKQHCGRRTLGGDPRCVQGQVEHQ